MLGLSCILDVVADEIASIRQGIREIGNAFLPDRTRVSQSEVCEWIATHAVDRLTTVHGIPTVNVPRFEGAIDRHASTWYADLKTPLASGMIFECTFHFDYEERSLEFCYAIITEHVHLAWNTCDYAADFDKFFDGEDIAVDAYFVDRSRCDFNSSFHDLKELHAAFVRANMGTFSLSWARAALDSWSDYDLDDPEAVTYCLEK